MVVLVCNSEPRWTKIQSVTIQMKPLDEYILMVVLVCNSEPVDENPKCDPSNENF